MEQHITKQPLDHRKKIKIEKKKPRDKWKTKYVIPKYMGCSRSGSKRKFHSVIGVLKRERERNLK